MRGERKFVAFYEIGPLVTVETEAVSHTMSGTRCSRAVARVLDHFARGCIHRLACEAGAGDLQRRRLGAMHVANTVFILSAALPKTKVRLMSDL